MELHINCVGMTCPMPMIKTREALNALGGPGKVTVRVDNETAMENVKKMALELGCGVETAQTAETEYTLILNAAHGVAAEEEVTACPDCGRQTVAVFGTDKMGEGSDELGKTLMKGFLYALTQQKEIPNILLFYNGGARLTCEGSESLEDLRVLQEKGARIYTCGTCLNFYGLTDRLAVGEVSNMYQIAQFMSSADRVVKP